MEKICEEKVEVEKIREECRTGEDLRRKLKWRRWEKKIEVETMREDERRWEKNKEVEKIRKEYGSGEKRWGRI